MIASLGVLVVIHLKDDTIRTEEDVERYLGLSVLGVIPMSEEISVGGKTVGGTKAGRKLVEDKPKTKK